MQTRKTLIMAKAGVRLERIEGLCAQGKVLQQVYKLSTRRLIRPRVMADKDIAEGAFDLEVIASLADPALARLVDTV